MPQKEPTRHHYVPRMILRNFVDEHGLLHCYRKDDEAQFSSTVGNAFVKNRLYAKHDTIRRRKDASKESELARSVEAPADLVVRKILRCARRGQEPCLTEAEKEAWDFFFCVQMRRTLALREVIDNEKMVDWARRETIKVLGPFSEEDEKEFRAEMGTPERRRSAVDNAWIDVLLARNDPLFGTLRNKGLLIVVLADLEIGFVIGSDPVVPMIPYGSTLEDEDASNLFPIAPDVLVACYGPSGSEELVTWHKGPDAREMVDALNSEILANSLIVASSSTKYLNRLLNRQREQHNGSY